MNGRARGFTFIEVVITMAIIALLAGVAAPLTATVVRREKEQDFKRALYELRDAIDAYKAAADAGHIERSLAASGYPPSLELLVEGARDLRSPTGARIFFLRRIPRDPFGDPDLEPAEQWGLRSYASPANDPRPGEDVFDVYSQSEERGLNGVPYREW